MKYITTLVLAFVMLAGQAFSEETKLQFVKLNRNFQGTATAMQLATIRYQDKHGTAIDLIPEIHIADSKHYQDRNRQFKEYDSVCFERVGSAEEKKIAIQNKGEDLGDIGSIGNMQKMVSQFLQLEHQMNVIDYSPKNMVHADVTLEELEKIMNKHGFSRDQMLMKMMQEMMAKQKDANPLGNLNIQPEDLIKAFLSSNGAKRILAEILIGNMDMIEGNAIGKALIDDRNDVALNVVKAELNKGKKKIGLHYGAGHMQDFHRKLIAMEFYPTEVRWDTAWEMKLSREEVLFDMMKQLLEDSQSPTP